MEAIVAIHNNARQELRNYEEFLEISNEVEK